MVPSILDSTPSFVKCSALGSGRSRLVVVFRERVLNGFPIGSRGNGWAREGVPLCCRRALPVFEVNAAAANVVGEASVR